MADVKISQLPAASSVTATDLVPIVDEPSGTAVTQRATASQVRDYVLAIATGTANITENLTVTGTITGTALVGPLTGNASTATTAGTVTTAAQPAITSVGTLTSLAVTGSVTASAFVGALTGNADTATSATSATTAGTVTTAAQPAITSVGTLTTLQVDNVNINGNTISSTAGTDLLITPLAGQQLVLDGTIVIDAGVVTGATSITSTTFVGALSGNATTATTAGTVTTAAQPAITSVGTLTGLAVSGTTEDRLTAALTSTDPNNDIIATFTRSGVSSGEHFVRATAPSGAHIAWEASVGTHKARLQVSAGAAYVGSYSATDFYLVYSSSARVVLTAGPSSDYEFRPYLANAVSLGEAGTPWKALYLTAGTTAVAPLSLPHGVAPTSPNDGDMWTTTAGLFVRINGATVGPLS